MLITVILVVLLLVVFPTTAPGRTLRRLLVDLPAQHLNSITRGQAAFYCALLMAGVVLFLLFETEGVKLFTFLAPDLLVWFTVFDVSLFLDVFIVGIMLATTTRVRVMTAPVMRWAQQVRSRAVARMSHRPRRKARTSRSNVASDDPEPVFGLAPA